MEIVLASAVAVVIVGCVVGYGMTIAADRPAEPRRRRPF
jgi:ribose 5-phosphate isomerase RpiB